LTQFCRGNDQGCGYEIHMGQTRRTGGQPLFQVSARNSVACREDDGCVSADCRIMGTYIHGLFDNPAITRFWLDGIGLSGIETPTLGGLEARNREYDLLAEHFAAHVNFDEIARLRSL
jgi:adenosylcobyric acid synthase